LEIIYVNPAFSEAFSILSPVLAQIDWLGFVEKDIPHPTVEVLAKGFQDYCIKADDILIGIGYQGIRRDPCLLRNSAHGQFPVFPDLFFSNQYFDTILNGHDYACSLVSSITRVYL
jgi:hypothetical protein